MEQNNFANMENKENLPFTNLVPHKNTNFQKPYQCDANMSSENKGSSMVSMVSADSKCSNMSVYNKSYSKIQFHPDSMQRKIDE